LQWNSQTLEPGVLISPEVDKHRPLMFSVMVPFAFTAQAWFWWAGSCARHQVMELV